MRTHVGPSAWLPVSDISEAPPEECARGHTKTQRESAGEAGDAHGATSVAALSELPDHTLTSWFPVDVNHGAAKARTGSGEEEEMRLRCITRAGGADAPGDSHYGTGRPRAAPIHL